MIFSFPKPSPVITAIYRENDCLYLNAELQKIRIMPISDQILRISVTKKEDFEPCYGVGLLEQTAYADWTYSDNDTEILLETAALHVVIRKETGSITY